MGYDTDNTFCGPMEPMRSKVDALLARMRTAYLMESGSDGIPREAITKLDPPPGPLCWGCDEPFSPDIVFPWATVKGRKVHHEQACKEEAIARLPEDAS